MRSWRVELYGTTGFLSLGTDIETFARAVGVGVDAESVVRDLSSSVVGSEFSFLVDFLVADRVVDGAGALVFILVFLALLCFLAGVVVDGSVSVVIFDFSAFLRFLEDAVVFAKGADTEACTVEDSVRTGTVTESVGAFKVAEVVGICTGDGALGTCSLAEAGESVGAVAFSMEGMVRFSQEAVTRVIPVDVGAVFVFLVMSGVFTAGEVSGAVFLEVDFLP